MKFINFLVLTTIVLAFIGCQTEKEKQEINKIRDEQHRKKIANTPLPEWEDEYIPLEQMLQNKNKSETGR